MNSSEKPEFREHAKQLVVGMRHLPHEEVLEALWVGMQQMSLGHFVQLKEHCLSENGPDKLPPVPGLWKIWRTIHEKQRAAARPALPPPSPPHSRARKHVTAMMFRYIHRRRMLEKVQGNIDIEARTRAAEDLVKFLEASAADDLMPGDEEVEAMFNVAMERISDYPDVETA